MEDDREEDREEDVDDEDDDENVRYGDIGSGSVSSMVIWEVDGQDEENGASDGDGGDTDQ